MVRQAGTLLAFWLVLSGKFDAFHIGLGAASSFATAYACRGLWPASPRPTLGRAAAWAAYLAWLGWEIFRASFQVARIVLSPRLPIDPGLHRVRLSLPAGLGPLTLANSITLTPGTVTLDLKDDEYLVHALTPASAQGLAVDGPGSMPRRVERLFAEARHR